MALDFKEIPEANHGGGLQDTFELFARDVLSYLGYRIVEDPDRGADGGRDLIVEEVMHGINSEDTVRWLVSCKHFAHSGRSVSDNDENNINDRLRQHDCQGFMGFYSTIVSSGLADRLSGAPFHYVFDNQKIEAIMLKDLEGQRIAARYFPKSFKQYQIEHPSPSDVFGHLEPIECEVCHKNLLLDTEHGNYILLKKIIRENKEGVPAIDKKYSKLVFACKEHDQEVSDKYRREGYIDGWEDIDDLCNPTIWIKRLMAFVNGIFNENDLTEEAFCQVKRMFIRTYPYICRHLTSKEYNRVRHLMQFGVL